MYWVTYLEYLQTVLKEFNTAATSPDELLIYYFRDDLRSSIQAQLEKWDQNIADWQEAKEHAIVAEAKINFQTPSLAWKSDAYCPLD